MTVKANDAYDRWWRENCRKPEGVWAKSEVWFPEEKLEKTDCDRRNEKSRIFSRVPPDLHLFFKKFCIIKQYKFQCRRSLDLGIHAADYPSLFFILCVILQCKLLVDGKTFGVRAAPSGLCFLYSRFSFWREFGIGKSLGLHIRG